MIKHLQNKTLRILLLALILGLSGTMNLFSQTVPTGAINGLFSVSESEQVYFSKGNLQYIGSASSPYWKFADHQWDYLGDNGQGSDNSNVDRDFFGWGTSRWNNGNTYYRPWDIETSINREDNSQLYGPPGSYSLTDSYANADWGVYNPISNGGKQANLWRSLTKNERNYVFNTRTTSSGIRYAEANVNGVNGVILLPDDWSTSYYTLNNANSMSQDVSFSSNTISYSTWMNSFEAHGAVFLPAAGVRLGDHIYDVGSYGTYWSASNYSVGGAYYMSFGDLGHMGTVNADAPRNNGRSVRLVCPVVNSSQSNTINVSASPSAGGSVSGAGTYNNGSSCTLTATPATEYKFTRWTQNGIQVSTNASYTFTVFASGSYEAEFTKDVITFADANVKALCVANWDTNGDNELSYVEAAAVTDLGSVFKGNTNITSFNELAYFTGVTTIANNAFQNCTNLTSVRIPNSVTSIGNSAFSGCTRLTSVTIPNSVTSIGNSAFSSCTRLTSVTIPNSVTSIDYNPFSSCSSMVAIAVEAGNNYYDSRDNCNAIIETSTNKLITGCKNTIIPNSVTSIGGSAFSDCTGLTSITIPNSVTSIGGSAFSGCTGLTSITIPNSVTSIEMWTFISCYGLTSITIPNSVTSIGISAFASCTGLTSVTIPNSVTSLGNSAFYRCTSLTSVTIPNSVTSIGQSVFKDCSSLSEVYYNATNCTNLTSGLNAPFQSCGGKLIIGDNVERIPNYMFYRAGFTGSLVIPNSVTSIGMEAFRGNGFTGSLTISSSVTTIGNYAFESCGFTALITERTIVPSTAGGAFYDMDYSIPVYVPAGKVSDYQSASGWSNFTNIKSQVKFVQNGNRKWSNVGNWSSGVLPTTEDVVCITDDCQLDADANVLYVYIADDAKVLTVNSGHTLNTTYGVHIENASQLVVEDDAQVKSDIPFSGTVQKHIDAYTSNDDGWNFIASPVTTNLVSAEVPGLIPTGTTVYDLYYLEEENTYWRNYKVNAFDINHKQGYLYANQAGTDINFSGAMQPYVAEGVSIPLTKEGDGWNLVGNPFTFNAYANKPYYVINGRNVEAAASGAIAPCTGIVVKANGTENEAVRFTKDAPVTSSAPNHGSLQIVLTEASSRSVSQIDNAIVSFNESETLPKFRFGDNAQIYLLQNNEDYAIANAEKTGEMPVNFKATRNGEYTLTVNPENVEMEYLHLIDNLTGNDVDLLVTPSYTFTAKADDYASRFRLVFSANNNNLNNDDNFAFISNGQLVVNSEGTLQVFDALGRQLYVKELSTANYQLPIVTSPGVYVLRLINGENVKTQKIVIK